MTLRGNFIDAGECNINVDHWGELTTVEQHSMSVTATKMLVLLTMNRIGQIDEHATWVLGQAEVQQLTCPQLGLWTR